jgi:hypothetical protein
MEPTAQMSYLEAISVNPGTLRDYRARLADFITWATSRGYDGSMPPELDALLVVLFDELYFKGFSSEFEARLIAAMKFFDTSFSRLGQHGLPRACRALTSWRKQAPPVQRLPFPFVALCAVIGWLLARREVEIALNLFLQFRTYVRPGVWDRLKVKQLVPPRPDAGPQYQNWAIILNPTEDRVP